MGGIVWFLIGALAAVVVVLAIALYRKSNSPESRRAGSPVAAPAQVSPQQTTESDWNMYDRAMDEAYKAHYQELKQSLTDLRSLDHKVVPLIRFRIRCAQTGIQLLSGDRNSGALHRSRTVDANPSVVIPSGCPVSVNSPGWAYCHVLYVITGCKASPAKVQAHIKREQLYTDAAIEKAREARGE